MGRKSARLSVIMPSYNVGGYINKCINSVVNQTYNNIEIICVDAGSSDGTFEIIKSAADRDKRIRIVRSDKKSYGYQVNLGIKKSNGDFIGIVETDDYIDKDFYQILMEKSDCADVVKGPAVGFKNFSGCIMKTVIREPYNTKCYGKVIYGRRLYDCLVTDPGIWNGIYRSDLIMKNHITLSETDGAAYQDTGFRYQIFFNTSGVYYVNKPLYYYRMDRDESSTYSPKALHNVTFEFDRLINEIFSDQNISQEAWDALWKGEISYFFGEFYRTIRLSDYDVTKDFIAEPYETYRRLAVKHPHEIARALDSLDETTRVYFDLIMRDINAFVSYRRSVDHVDQQMAKNIRDKADGRHLIIVGNGTRGKGLYQFCFDHDIPVDAYADNDSSKWSDETNCSAAILLPERAVEKYSDDAFFIANKNHEEELRQQLRDLGISDSRIIVWHP